MDTLFRLIGTGDDLERRMHDPDGFARRLDLALRARRIGKMYALAVALDIDESALSRWRRGRSISVDNLVRLSRHLRVSIDWLLTGAGSMELAEAEAGGARRSEILADLATLDPATCEHLAGLMRHLAVAHRAAPFELRASALDLRAAASRASDRRDIGS